MKTKTLTYAEAIFWLCETPRNAELMCERFYVQKHEYNCINLLIWVFSDGSAIRLKDKDLAIDFGEWAIK